MRKAVLLGAFYYIGLGVIRSLGRRGVPVVVMEHDPPGAYALSSRYISETVRCPHFIRERRALLEHLLAYAHAQDAPPVLIPCADPQVQFVEEFAAELGEVYLLPRRPPGLAIDLLDKTRLARVAERHGVRIPRTLPLDGDVEAALDAVESQIGWPALIKPADSVRFMAWFRKKLFVAENRDAARTALALAREYRLVMFAQEYVPGFDDQMYCYDTYLDSAGETVAWTTIRKLHQYPAGFGVASLARCERVPQLHQIGEAFLREIGWRGFAEIEFKRHTATGEFYLIEVNVRMVNFTALLEAIGLNPAWLTYLELTGGRLARPGELSTRHVYWHSSEDLSALRQYRSSGRLALTRVDGDRAGAADLLTPLTPRLVPAVFAVDDVAPYARFLAQTAEPMRTKAITAWTRLKERIGR